MPLLTALNQILPLLCPVLAANNLNPSRSRTCPVAPHWIQSVGENSGSSVGRRRAGPGFSFRFTSPPPPASSEQSGVSRGWALGEPLPQASSLHTGGVPAGPWWQGCPQSHSLLIPLTLLKRHAQLLPNLLRETFWRVPSASLGPLPDTITLQSSSGSG